MTPMTLRRAMSLVAFSILFALAAPLGVAAQAAPAQAGAASEGPIVLIVGGGSAHDFDRWFRDADGSIIEATGARVRYTDVPDQILPLLADADVLYLTANQPLPDPALRRAVFAHVAAGKGLIIGHAGAWMNWADWPEFNPTLVGGVSRSHPRYGEFHVNLSGVSHPVTAGVPSSFSISDEMYRFEVAAEGSSITVLASAREEARDAVYPIVFIVDHPQGRIVVNTLGHDGAARDTAAYVRILQNSVRWASRQVD